MTSLPLMAPTSVLARGVQPAPPSTPSGPAAAYRPAPSPYRILDTRDGTGAPQAQLGPGGVLDVQVAGTGGEGGVPSSGATAVALNLTVTNASEGSYVTVFPAGSGSPPLASNVNFAAGQTLANLAIVSLGTGGKVSVYNSRGWVDLVFDVQGWTNQAPTDTAGLYRPLLRPLRVLDTRLSGGPLGPASTRSVSLLPFIHDPAVAAAQFNVTTVGGSQASYLTVYPTGTERPLASNVNFPGQRDQANRVLGRLAQGGQVDVFNAQGSVDLVIDLNGYYSDGSDPGASGGAFHSMAPGRLLDTRTAASPLGPGETRVVAVAGTSLVPAGAGSVVLNVTVIGANTGGLLTLFPFGVSAPITSDLNFRQGEVIANLATVRLGSSGRIAVYNAEGRVDVILDVAGWYEPAPSPPAESGCAPVPHACGYPDPTNTGVPAGTQLTDSGSITVTSAGTVIDAMNITGRIHVQANNVTIKRTHVNMQLAAGAWGEGIRIEPGISGTQIRDVEIEGGIPVSDFYTNAFCIGGYAWGTTTVTRVNCHNVGTFSMQPSNATFTDNYIHDLQFGGASGTHTQALSVQNGSHVVFRHNTADGFNASTAPVFVNAYGGATTTDVALDNNLIIGNPASYYLVTQAASDGNCNTVTNTRYTNNRWAGRDSPPRPQFNFGCNYSVWSGNVWDDTGEPLDL